ncbi:ATP-dependent DNA helicase [Salinibacterium hongtaonis]|uniref:ATP-dependent DNA helicase n=1 Tax=Homoserinimonas hongtaonis TaxID=2079791 RepID=UPI0030CE14FF
MTDTAVMRDDDELARADAAPARVLSADEIADALGQHRPTPQQRAVIESPLEPALVVAGAGSGKTETMASRVLWLIANGHVSPGQILGLTFTRKAAGELAERIRNRIAQLADAGLVPGEHDPFDTPTVATYNSFANTIYRDNAMLLGRESDGDVLGEASAWQLARSIVIASQDERLASVDKSLDTITRAVLDISHGLAENIADADDVAAMAEEFARIADLPTGGRGAYAEIEKHAAVVGSLPLLIDLARQFERAKAEHGFVEYSDQVALALELVRKVPRIRDDLRGQYRVVLLDEYQDTSVVQTWLLSGIFGGHPVMAVGDPHQSIYGWRGASSANLEDFARQFGEPATSVAEFSLATSWRNGHGILEAANALVDPLTATTRVAVQRLQPAPTATDSPISFSYEEDLATEADTAARWLKSRLAVPVRDGAGVRAPSAAMLFRTRKTQAVFIDALRQHEIPFHVLGVGGLMEEPEIADLVSALTVINDPAAGSELVRLLSGSRWRIGARDLHGLRRIASRLRDRDFAHRPLDDEIRTRLRESVSDDDGASIVDALDFVATAKPDHGLITGISDEGLARLRDAGAVLARLRSRSGLDLLDFVTMVEQELMLDIEVAANPDRVLGRAPLDAFFDALSGYLTVDDSPSLRSFLGWLREAAWRDNLAPRPEEAEPGTVQIMTIHGSKGLERDIIVVPRLVDGELPGTPLEGTGAWLGFGRLPWEFRGDAAELPTLEWRTAETRKELVDLIADFKAEVSHHHEREERRLAYVAITRARHDLLLTGSFWSGQVKPRRPSSFLVELAALGIVPPLPEGPAEEFAPDGIDEFDVVWPFDPLGGRRSRVEAGAALVEEARLALTAGTEVTAGAWQDDLDLLLAERKRRTEPAGRAEPPIRVPASRFKDYVTDPDAVAAALRRPMPERPYRATRLGTLFHEWVEDRYGVHGSSEELDAFDDEIDLGDTVDSAVLSQQLKFDELRRTFERSPWASIRPVDVEREIHLPLADRVVICKIDAVYPLEGDRFQVVDWKTGKAPRDAKDLEDKQLQLALYRQAYAEWRGIDPERIDAVFYYVSDDAIIRPERIFDREELEALWRASRTR